MYVQVYVRCCRRTCLHAIDGVSYRAIFMVSYRAIFMCHSESGNNLDKSHVPRVTECKLVI